MKRKILRGFRFRISELADLQHKSRVFCEFAQYVFGRIGAEPGNLEVVANLHRLRDFLDDFGDFVAQHEVRLRRLRGLPELQSESESIWKNWRLRPQTHSQEVEKLPSA